MRYLQNTVEPMQVDAPPEDNDNNEEENYIVENPSMDLEAYANSYTGLARLYRLGSLSCFLVIPNSIS